MTDLKELIERLRSVDADMNDENGGGKGPSLFQEAADALEAKLCAVVKPLEWHIKPDTTYKAEGVAGVYEVYPNQQGNWTLDDGMSVSGHEIPCAAKEAGNKEEAKRTISTLTIRSASDVAAEARAGAIEAAAGGIVNLPLPYERWSDGQCGAVLVALQKHADSIRALHDTDTLAAIERIKEQARQEERERIAAWIESHTYTSVGDAREMLPVLPIMVGADQHHATIAKAIREGE